MSVKKQHGGVRALSPAVRNEPKLYGAPLALGSGDSDGNNTGLYISSAIGSPMQSAGAVGLGGTQP